MSDNEEQRDNIGELKNKRGRKKKKNYFAEEEEAAVLRFLAAESDQERNEIYCTFLKFPIEKMVESIINRYKLYNSEMSYEELQADTISFLNEKINKFKPTKGRAYSYFGTIVRRRLQSNLLLIQKRTNLFVNYSDTYKSFSEDETLVEEAHDNIDHRPQHILDSLFYEMIEIIKEILTEDTNTKVLKEKERKVGLAVIEIMEQKDMIFESYDNNKFTKAQVLQCLREMTGYTTKEITNSLLYYKQVYLKKKKKFIEKFDL